jgi:hypothetical protein
MWCLSRTEEVRKLPAFAPAPPFRCGRIPRIERDEGTLQTCSRHLTPSKPASANGRNGLRVYGNALITSRSTTRASKLATCTTRSGASSSSPPSVSVVACPVEDFALTLAERRLIQALNDRDVPFLLVGLSAALLQGAPVATQDLDFWFASTDDERIGEAARDAGGFWISAFDKQPAAFGGDGLDRIDVVLMAHGLETFDSEYARAITCQIDGVIIRTLPLHRIIANKRASSRAKDLAQLPALEATLLAQQDQSDIGS